MIYDKNVLSSGTIDLELVKSSCVNIMNWINENKDPKSLENIHHSDFIQITYQFELNQFRLNLVKLENTLVDLYKKSSNILCSLCNKKSSKCSIWLLCGDYICSVSCKSSNKSSQEIGNLTRHSIVWGGRTCVFLNVISGELIYMFEGHAIGMRSPYLNKYNEPYNTQNNNDYDTYQLNEGTL